MPLAILSFIVAVGLGLLLFFLLLRNKKKKEKRQVDSRVRPYQMDDVEVVAARPTTREGDLEMNDLAPMDSHRTGSGTVRSENEISHKEEATPAFRIKTDTP